MSSKPRITIGKPMRRKGRISGPVNGSWVAAAVAGVPSVGAVAAAATAGWTDEAPADGGVTALLGGGVASVVEVVLVDVLVVEVEVEVVLVDVLVVGGGVVVVVVVQPQSAMALLEMVAASPDAPQATPPMAAPKATVTMAALTTAVNLFMLTSFVSTARPAVPCPSDRGAGLVSRRSTTGAL